MANGKELSSHGACNEKGSVTGSFACKFIESVIPMMNAYGRLTATALAHT